VASASVSPTSYNVEDTYPLNFTVTTTASTGYENPVWSVTGGSNKTPTTFDMSIFNTTKPVVTITGGDIITYNMNIIKGTGINNYKYGTTTYSVSGTVDTYNVLSTKTVRLININVINNL